jgi:hypothetical protein
MNGGKVATAEDFNGATIRVERAVFEPKPVPIPAWVSGERAARDVRQDYVYFTGAAGTWFCVRLAEQQGSIYGRGVRVMVVLGAGRLWVVTGWEAARVLEVVPEPTDGSAVDPWALARRGVRRALREVIDDEDGGEP